jgi:hypothetical protein
MRQEAWTTRDEARARCAELEKELRDKELDAKLEIDRLKDSLKHSDEALQRERVLRRREAQGEILHEEGKVLIRCTKCYEVGCFWHSLFISAIIYFIIFSIHRTVRRRPLRPRRRGPRHDQHPPAQRRVSARVRDGPDAQVCWSAFIRRCLAGFDWSWYVKGPYKILV